MTNNSIYTGKILRLDKRVWGVMIAAIIIPLFLLSFRLFDKKECIAIEYNIKSIAGNMGNTFVPGETISFRASSNTNDITWDFGDNSEKSYGKYVIHKFHAAGTYVVNASVGQGCEINLKRVTIKDPVVAKENTTAGLNTGDELVGPVSTITGKQESFTCMVSAGTYEWSILNYPKMTQSGQIAKFLFPGHGKYTIQVTLDNDRLKRYTKEITVSDDPEKPKPKNSLPEDISLLIPPQINQPVQQTPVPDQKPAVKADTPVAAIAKKYTIIADKTFQDYLENVINKQMVSKDFEKYLCGGDGTPVIVNGKRGEQKTFGQLCADISKKQSKLFGIVKKTIRIESVVQHRDNNCVTLIEVNY